MKSSIGSRAIVFPAPVLVVATYDKEHKPNAMTAAWGGICASAPACICVSLREATYTYGNILERRAFTVNIPSEKFVEEADYFGITSGKTEDKFIGSGLTAVKSEHVDAPYIKEFPLVIECALRQTIPLGLHTLFVGDIKDIKAEKSYLDHEGIPNIEKIKPIVFNPANRTYYKTGKFLAEAFSIGKERIT